MKCLEPGYFKSKNWPPGFEPQPYTPKRELTEAQRNNLLRGRTAQNAQAKRGKKKK